MASQTWTSRYQQGDFVEVNRNGDWILSVVNAVHNRGYFEYSLTLSNNGEECLEVARNMRKAEVAVEDLVVDEMIFEEPARPAEALGAPVTTEKKEEPKKRFASVDKEQLDEIEVSAKAAKTIQQTKWAVKIFRDWLIETGKNPAFEEAMPTDLAATLRQFYAEVRNKNGDEYCKKSLICIRAALHRHLTGSPYNVEYNIMSDVIFKSANTTLLGHIKSNKRAGLDKSSSYPAITELDKQKMYQSRTLSHDDPTSLQYKVFFEVCLHFGRRAREGLHDLRKDQFVFLKDSNNVEYATLNFNPLEKNHQGNSSNEGEHSQRMYATDFQDCLLTTLKFYLSILNAANTSFFQTPKKRNYRLSNAWYCNSPVGINTLGKFMSNISTKAGLSRMYTNHCIRATCVTTLREKGVPCKDIKSVTGHRSEASIDFYSKTPDVVRQQMSNTLAGVDKAPNVSLSVAKPKEVSDEIPKEVSLTQTNVMNVQRSDQSSPLFAHVNFRDCTFNININK